MRRLACIALLLSLGGCSSLNDGTTGSSLTSQARADEHAPEYAGLDDGTSLDAARPEGLSFSHTKYAKYIDRVGLPDLIFDARATAAAWLIRDEDMRNDACAAEEGGVQPGVHRILRFTVTTPNIGNADVYVGDPREHYAANDGLFELDGCHGHFHYRNYATYKLVSASTGQEWRAAKRGFCLLDNEPNPSYLPVRATRPRIFRTCGTPREAGFQGISHGYGDRYSYTLSGQFFVLDGGDGQPPVPPGNYFIRVEVNPAFAPGSSGCRFVQDPNGLCRNFPESDYSNNVADVAISIPGTVSRGGFGPLGKQH